MLTAAGVEALLKVKEQKLADPDSLVMYTFRDPFGATCIAGQLILNEYGVEKLEEAEEMHFGCHKLASSILGIPFKRSDPDEERVTDSLFYKQDWDNDLFDRWQRSPFFSSEERAQIVAEVIDRFISKYYNKGEQNAD
jgi:hypothetical protein